jgi:polyisoprenoid-binding protein YceI
MSDFPDNSEPTATGPSFPRWLKWGLLGALAILIVGYGLIFLYAKVLNDAPDELGTGDLDAALSTGTTVGDVSADETQPTVAGGDGSVWTVTDASEIGYRVKEVLFGVDTEAVGRTNQITGSLTIGDSEVIAAEFVVDVASISSDESKRDGQFRGRIMSTDEFPEAVFTLTEPIELGTSPADGVEVATSATGELTLRGVTNPVTFDLTAKLENGKIGVLGNIPVVFAEYGIANPSIGGITTEDNGLLEFVLVFSPS